MFSTLVAACFVVCDFVGVILVIVLTMLPICCVLFDLWCAPGCWGFGLVLLMFGLFVIVWVLCFVDMLLSRKFCYLCCLLLVVY